MPCRDYEYEEWLGKTYQRLNQLVDLLRQLCRAAERAGLEMPPPVARWWQANQSELAEGTTITQETIDNVAQLLCQLCQTAERAGLETPPAVAAWWQEHKAKDEQADRAAEEAAPASADRARSSAKEDALALIRSLPDDCTFGDVKNCLHVFGRMREGLLALEKEGSLSAEQVDMAWGICLSGGMMAEPGRDASPEAVEREVDAWLQSLKGGREEAPELP